MTCPKRLIEVDLPIHRISDARAEVEVHPSHPNLHAS